MKRIAAVLALAFWAGLASAQAYVAVGLVDLEPEIALGYDTGPTSIEIATYGPHELGRIRSLASAKTWSLEDGLRLTGRLAFPLAPWVDATIGASALHARYEHIARTVDSQRAWTAGLHVGARFALKEISPNAALRIEWMRASTPAGYASMSGLRVGFELRSR